MSGEMFEKDKFAPGQQARVRPGLSARRSSVSFQTQADIVIPAGTILRSIGDDQYSADIGLGPNSRAGEFTITAKPGVAVPALLKRVASS